MTYEEFIKTMRETIPACDWDQNEIDDVWEDMCRYEMYNGEDYDYEYYHEC